MKVKVKWGNYIPERAHFDDAGIDFKTPVSFVLPAHGYKVIDLGISVQIPIGYFGKIESKSGLLVNHGICSMGGVIDSGYRGDIKVGMINHSDEDYEFLAGDKLVQMVLIPVGLFDIDLVEELDPAESGRDENGWGSTGR